MAQYQVLARKWRPQQFDDVIGQEHITQTLVNAVKNKRLAHAYLLVGPRGTGKTTTARILAKALNCEKGPTATPCDKCSNCKEIADGSSFNVMEYDAASNTQVDKIRELIIENVKYAPTGGKYKVYIVDEVHMLSQSSFNALLKTLEEPPEHVIFVFATTEVSKLPLTILSRCQRFDLRRIPANLIIGHLTRIAKDEKVQIEEEALSAIARGCEGCMRDAQSTLDQLIGYCGNKIAEADVLSMFGLAAQKQIGELTEAILAGDANGALKLLNALAEGGKDLTRLLTELMERFRNMLIVKVSGDKPGLDVTAAEMSSLQKSAASVDADTLLRILDVLGGTEARLKYSAAKKIFFEMALIKAIKAREAAGIDAVLQKLNALRGGAPPPTSGGSLGATAGRVAESPVPKLGAAPKPAGPVRHRMEGAGRLAEIWNDIHEHFGQAAPLARAYLKQAHPLSFDGQTFVIGFDPEFKSALEFLNASRYRTILQTKLREAIGHDVTLKFEIAEDPGLAEKKATPAAGLPASSPAPAPRREAAPPPPGGKTDIRNDPLIKKALEIFRGQIVEVRA
ncbi:MAG: DNA polymerase III subunit gamma/tau [Verrucomicrobia bacterium]|nr:DNA polymerase III subunit gamma/tau [Verrucomicrobiota bacterium]